MKLNDGLSNLRLICVATPTPIRHLLTYAIADHESGDRYISGVRVSVPLGRRQVVGIVSHIGSDIHKISLPAKIKTISHYIDSEPLLPRTIMDLANWASQYYQYPIGQVYQYVLPTLLRNGESATRQNIDCWVITQTGQELDKTQLARSPKQLQLLEFIKLTPNGASAECLNAEFDHWRAPMKRLVERHYVLVSSQIKGSDPFGKKGSDPLTADLGLSVEQAAAVAGVSADWGRFAVHLLHGVTGSGKTEVYLQLARQVIDAGQQVLILVPEIGLTPQLMSRFSRRFAATVVCLHSGLTDRQRLNQWLMAQKSEAAIVIGTRSAVFTPLPKLGLIVVDEEHDVSFKQQEGFRFSARDVAIKRAQLDNVPIVLGSATPSLETLHNAWQKKYRQHDLLARAGNAKAPTTRIVDLRSQALDAGLSNQLIASIREHLAANNQVLLFLNRRGFSPTLLCHVCGWIADCSRCDSHMTLYQHSKRLRCHHCMAERRAFTVCPECRSEELIPVGEGTERVEQRLVELFANVEVLRIDRDTTRRKDALNNILDKIHQGGAKILLGTQMLAKGHHFPDVTLVGILNVDQGLFSIDFRALERMAQLIVQVSGRAGRGDKRGEVMLQTHHPDHPSLLRLIKKGYVPFAQQTLTDRQQSQLPPISYLALLRAQSSKMEQAMLFLQQARDLGGDLLDHQRMLLLGPIPAPMPKRAGRYRAQLLIQCTSRQQRQHFLSHWITRLEASTLARKVRWALDVDPVDMY